MKKRLLAIVLGLVLSAASLSGCTGAGGNSGPVNAGHNNGTEGQDNTQAGDTDVTPADTDTDADTDDTAADGKGEEGSESGEAETETADTETADTGERFVLQDEGSTKIYLVDIKGNKKGEYDAEDFVDEVPGVTQALSVKALDYYDGVIVCYAGYYEGYDWKKAIFGYDTEIDRPIDIYTLPDEEFLESVDVYNDKLYLTTYDYQGTDGACRFIEREFARYGNRGFDFTAAPSMSVLNSLNGYYIKLNRDNNANYYAYECVTRSLEEYGYIAATKDKDLYVVDGAGKTTVVDNPFDSYPTIEGYDADGLFYKVTGNTNDSYIYRYKTDTKISFMVSELNGAYLLDYSDGNMYFYKNLSEEYGRSDNCVCRYNTESESVETIYDIWKVPGTTYSPAIEGFTIIDGQIYFVDVMDRSLKWVRVNYDESGASYTDIYCPVAEIGVFKYGDVKYHSQTIKCPYCGIHLYDSYREAFQILPELSDKYNDINQHLLDAIAGEDEVVDGISEDECEDHLAYPQMYDETHEWTVSDVRKIGDKYLTIDMDGYWYAGGAHGMPYRDHYLIDLETGEFKTLKDLYDGTDEDFVSLIESIVERDYNNGEDYISYMYTDDYQDIMSNIRQSTSLDMVGVCYMEDGVNIEYAPYVLGPFASGFIQIKVTYQELLGRNSL